MLGTVQEQKPRFFSLILIQRFCFNFVIFTAGVVLFVVCFVGVVFSFFSFFIFSNPQLWSIRSVN